MLDIWPFIARRDSFSSQGRARENRFCRITVIIRFPRTESLIAPRVLRLAIPPRFSFLLLFSAPRFFDRMQTIARPRLSSRRDEIIPRGCFLRGCRSPVNSSSVANDGRSAATLGTVAAAEMSVYGQAAETNSRIRPRRRRRGSRGVVTSYCGRTRLGKHSVRGTPRFVGSNTPGANRSLELVRSKLNSAGLNGFFLSW